MEQNISAAQQPDAVSPNAPQDASGNSALPFALIGLGVFELIGSAALSFIEVKLLDLYAALQIESQNSFLTFGVTGLFLTVSILQIVLGIKLQKKQKRGGELTDKQRKTALIVFGIGLAVLLFSIPVFINFVIMPIYQITSSF